jgi:endonuclease/exonuclease/phosphatase family metal-dependent hydrolase
MADPLKVLTWNVAGRLSRLDEQVDRALAHAADVICLQEVIPNALARWTERLQAAGHAVAASAVAPDAPRVHRLGVLVASRHPILFAGPGAAVPWPERLLAVDAQPAGWPLPLRVMSLHAPLSQREGQVKVRTLEAVHASLSAHDAGLAAVLCGDFNTPQYEARDGAVQTFAQTRTGNLRPARGERHDRAERMIVAGPPGWQDAFRTLHGYAARDRSWKTGRHPGYRLDHILVSPALEPIACAYDHGVREDGLSDHSAMWALVAPRPAGG